MSRIYETRTFLTRKVADFSDCCCVRPDGLVYVIANKWTDRTFRKLSRILFAIAPNGEIIKKVEIEGLNSHVHALVWAHGPLYAMGNSGMFQINLDNGNCTHLLRRKDFKSFGLRAPRDVTVAPDRELYAISGNGERILKITLDGDAKISVVAGTVETSHSGSTSSFKHLHSMHSGIDGHLYVTSSHKIQHIPLSTLKAETICGTSQSGNLDGASDDARFHKPAGIRQDSDGQLYVSDTANYCIRKISRRKKNVPQIVATMKLQWKPGDVNTFTSFDWAFSPETRVCGIDRRYCWLYVKCDAGILQIDIKKNGTERPQYVHPQLEYKEPDKEESSPPQLKIDWGIVTTPNLEALISPKRRLIPLTLTPTPTPTPTPEKKDKIEGRSGEEGEPEPDADIQQEGSGSGEGAEGSFTDRSTDGEATDDNFDDIWDFAKTDDVSPFLEVFERHPDVLNETDEQYGATLSHYAAGWGSENVLSHLLENGADVEKKSLNGYTPLHTAASRGKFKTVQMLVAANCDVNVRGKGHHTALHVACKRENATEDYFKVVEALVAGNASTKCKDESERTALDYAHERNNQKIIEYLTPRTNKPRYKSPLRTGQRRSLTGSSTRFPKLGAPRLSGPRLSLDSGLCSPGDYTAQSDSETLSDTDVPTDFPYNTGDDDSTEITTSSKSHNVVLRSGLTPLLSDTDDTKSVSTRFSGNRSSALRSLPETTEHDGSTSFDDRSEEIRKEDEEMKKKMEQKKEREQFVQESSAGVRFKKHGRHGKPHSRDVYVDLEKRTISWKQGKYISFKNISHIKKGKISKVLHRQTAKDARDDRCLSIYQVGINKTLDLEAPTSTIRNSWYKWLLYYTKEHWGTQERV